VGYLAVGRVNLFLCISVLERNNHLGTIGGTLNNFGKYIKPEEALKRHNELALGQKRGQNDTEFFASIKPY
jgi:hypothetical protein